MPPEDESKRSMQEKTEKDILPLSLERFTTHSNNYFLQFFDDPLNYHRYQISQEEIGDAVERHERGESLSFPLQPLLEKLKDEDPELERKLTKSVTEARQQKTDPVAPNISLLYRAYLIQRKHLKPGENEGVAFKFNIYYPEE